jgi:hypothetical protein
MDRKRRRRAVRLDAVRVEPPECIIEFTGEDVFMVFNGVKIAKRGHPKTPQAGTWVSLEPGWRVFGGKSDLVVEYEGTRVQ